MSNPKFSILITTKNRKKDLAFTLQKSQNLLQCQDVKIIICDDGSIDGTSAFIREKYPSIQLIQNEKSKGLIYSRNRLMNLVATEFAIIIDDDSHFITHNPLEVIKEKFYKNANIGVLGFRIYWNLEEPATIQSNEISYRMKSFVGCGHVWRMSAWRDIPDYPDWFVFYGEEDFASYQLFKKKWEIHYLPEILINHRVNVKARKNNQDYSLRLQRSLRAGWYLYFLFFPLKLIPRKMVYSILMQLKLKVLKGDFRAFKALLFAMLDLVFSIPKIIKNSNRLTQREIEMYNQLPETKIYWRAEK
ncbi:glycosyltransferase family 2 protein [Flavobacterium sp. 3-210]